MDIELVLTLVPIVVAIIVGILVIKKSRKEKHKIMKMIHKAQELEDDLRTVIAELEKLKPASIE